MASTILLGHKLSAPGNGGWTKTPLRETVQGSSLKRLWILEDVIEFLSVSIQFLYDTEVEKI